MALIDEHRGPEWLTDIENAPKDGSEVLFPIEFVGRAYWDGDLKRWVLSHQIKMDYVPHPTRYRLPRQETDHGDG